MMNSRSLETSRMEIMFIAAGVLMLVSLMGIFILLGVGLRPPSAYRYTIRSQRRTPWGAFYSSSSSHDHDQRRFTAPYRDVDSTTATTTNFFGGIRSHSQTLATEIRNELNSLTQNLAAGMASWSASQRSEDSHMLEALRKFSLEKPGRAQRHCSDVDSCDTCSDFLNSPVSVSGREDEPDGARVRLISHDGKGMTSSRADQDVRL